MAVANSHAGTESIVLVRRDKGIGPGLTCRFPGAARSGGALDGVGVSVLRQCCKRGQSSMARCIYGPNLSLQAACFPSRQVSSAKVYNDRYYLSLPRALMYILA